MRTSASHRRFGVFLRAALRSRAGCRLWAGFALGDLRFDLVGDVLVATAAIGVVEESICFRRLNMFVCLSVRSKPGEAGSFDRPLAVRRVFRHVPICARRVTSGCSGC